LELADENLLLALVFLKILFLSHLRLELMFEIKILSSNSIAYGALASQIKLSLFASLLGRAELILYHPELVPELDTFLIKSLMLKNCGRFLIVHLSGKTCHLEL
jgi:hypothetical protein